MTMPFIEYSEIFDNENIGDVGMLFFKAIGHLSGNSPRYYERDAITLIKEDLYSQIDLSFDDENVLSCVSQIAYLDRLNDSLFEKKSDDGFISYFAVEIKGSIHTCASDVKAVQHILMRCTNRHNIILYRIDGGYILSYGYRAIGKNSTVTYSKWLIDDESAEEVMDLASIWNMPMTSLVRFAFEFRNAIRRDPDEVLSYSTIAYEIFPDYYEQYDYDSDHIPSKEAREEFVEWYRREHQIEDFDEFNDESIYLLKEGLLVDDFEIDEDELEMRMLEAEMNGELNPEYFASEKDDYEEIDDDEFNAALKLAQSMDDLDDPEAILKAMEEQETVEVEKNIISVQPIQTTTSSAVVPNRVSEHSGYPSFENVDTSFEGTIYEIISHFEPEFPFAIRRNKWKTTTLFFMVEELRGNYAYGYMINNGVREKNTSYPANNSDIIWQLCRPLNDDIEASDDESEYDGLELPSVDISIYDDDEYTIEFDTIRVEGNTLLLSFWIVNDSDDPIRIYAHDTIIDSEEQDEYIEFCAINPYERNYYELPLIEDDSLDPYYDIKLKLEINDEDNEAICESSVLSIHVSLINEKLEASVEDDE